MNGTNLVLGMLLGAVGAGYLVYGRRQGKGSALLAGVGLMVFPYFVSGLLITLGVAVVLAALPFLVEF